MLSVYLRQFVDKPVERLITQGKIKMDNMLLHQDWHEAHTISFNYTHTMQELYQRNWTPSPIVHYVHGELSEESETRIVLGFEADELDERGKVDVTFVQFKKYFQRVFFRTDLSYIDFLDYMEGTKQTYDYITLHVIGHSLDFTDHEIIEDCFHGSGRIKIYYHSTGALSDYIRNLLKIFGKRDFDRLRTQKNLEFLPISELNKLSKAT